MPWMNAERRMAGSSMATISGMRLCNSSNSTRISRRARLAPRQKWAPPPPYPKCGLGFRVTSNNHGLSNLVSSRLAEFYHIETLSPAFIVTPPSSTSSLRLRRM